MCLRAGVQFSLVLTKNRAVARATAAIPEDAWTAVHSIPGPCSIPTLGS